MQTPLEEPSTLVLEKHVHTDMHLTYTSHILSIHQLTHWQKFSNSSSFFAFSWLCSTVQMKSDRKQGNRSDFEPWVAAVRTQLLYMGHTFYQLSYWWTPFTRNIKEKTPIVKFTIMYLTSMAHYIRTLEFKVFCANSEPWWRKIKFLHHCMSTVSRKAVIL